jgi:nitrate/nitrite transporter NarK
VKERKSFKFYTTLILIAAFFVQYFQVALAVDGVNVMIIALEEYGWGRMEINSAISLGALLSVIGVFTFGTIIMKFSNRVFLAPVSLLIGADLLWMANTTDLSQFRISMIILQILLVGPYLSTFALIANWFLKKRGLMLGIITIGAPLSAATFTPIATKLIGVTSFATVYSAIGIFYALYGVLVMFLVNEKPEDFGYAQDDIEKTPEEIEAAKAELERESEWPLSRLLKTKETYLLVFSFGLIYVMMTGIMSQLIPRLTDVGFTINQALMMMSIAALGGMPMSYVWGWLDDKYGTPKTCVIFSWAYILGSVCFVFGSSDNIIATFGGILAISLTTGGMPNLQPSIQAWVFGRKDFVNTNRYINMGHMVLRSSAFTIMGMIYATFGTYTPAYILFIGLSIICMILFMMIKTTYDPDRLALMEEQKKTANG